MFVIMIVGIIVLFIIIAVLIVYLVKLKRKDSRSRNKNIVVSNVGYLANEYARNSLGGGILYGENADCMTVIGDMSGKKPVHENKKNVIIFTNMQSHETTEKTISGQLNVVRGRDTGDNSLFGVDDPRVSHKHCCFYMNEGCIYLHDMNSTNHTYVNYRQISEDTPINDGDIVSFGNVAFLVKIV